MATPSNPPRSSLSKIVSQIAEHTSVLERYLEVNDLPEPSFDRNGPPGWNIPHDNDAATARLELLEAVNSLHDLVLGPTEFLTRSALTPKFDAAALRTITNYNIASAVPLEGEASYKEIAAAVGLNEDFTTRIIRYAATSRIFVEHRPGYISHTAASARLASNPEDVTHSLVTVFPAVAKLDETVQKFPNTGSADADPYQSAFQVGWGTDKGYFDWIEEEGNERHQKAFHETMNAVEAMALTGERIATANIWKELKAGSTVVDVGGSRGHVSFVLAAAHPNLHFVVQDRPPVVAAGEANMPDDMRERVTFMAHDILTPQPLTSDLYFIRFILHDWPDLYAAKILQNVVGAMKPGAKVVIVDAVMAPPGTLPKSLEKVQRAVDLHMMTALNSRERSLDDWNALFQRTDERLKIDDVWAPEGSTHSMIIAGLAS